MFINSLGYYIPQKRVYNDYFAELHNSTVDWYVKRTGILSRSRAEEHETLNFMSIEAVKNAIPKLHYNIKEVDLIIFASYTPEDTVATTGHIVQREFQIEKAKVFYISSACSSGVNAIEIINSFFKTGIAKKALLICGDRNSTYSIDHDPQSGHLWGDCATAFFFSKEPTAENEPQIVDVHTQGLGHIGHGPEAVTLNPKKGIEMPFGKDVFTQACTYISSATVDILKQNGYFINDLSYFIGHQANSRILSYVCGMLEIAPEKSLTNIEELGNTGCASSFLVLAQNFDKFKKGDLVCLTVFGGGYSVGACLFKF
jgi:3-oxoacyl-[acyl-carrier-protein] synthase-3